MNGFAQRGIFRSDFFQAHNVRTVDIPGINVGFMLQPAVYPQLIGRGTAGVETRHFRGRVDHILTHFPVGRPFSPGDGHETRSGDLNGVFTGKRRRVEDIARSDKRAQTGKGAEHVGLRRIPREIARGVGQEKIDLLAERSRLKRDLCHRRVGRPDDNTVMPWNGEEDTTVGCVRDHDGGFGREKCLVKDDMHPLARDNAVRHCGVVHAEDGVGEDACRVHRDPAADFDFLAAFHVPRHDTVHTPLCLQEMRHLHVVDRGSSQIGQGLSEIDGQPRIIELSIMIDDPAPETSGFQSRNPFEGLFPGDVHGRSQAEAPGEHVVDLEAHAVEGSLPPVVIGDHEGEIVHEMRGILKEDSSLAKGFQNQPHVSLLKIPDPAVDEFGAPARRAF